MVARVYFAFVERVYRYYELVHHKPRTIESKELDLNKLNLQIPVTGRFSIICD